MRKGERREEHDMTAQVFTHANRVTNFSTFSIEQVQPMACALFSSARRVLSKLLLLA